MSLLYLGSLGRAAILSKSARVPAALAHAMATVPAIVAAAHSETDDIRREARDHGYAEGFAQGQAELARLIADTHTKAAHYMQEMQPVLVDCIVQAVRTLVDEADPAILIKRSVELVRERLGNADGLVLKVCQYRYEAAEKAAELLMQKYGAAIPVRVVVDNSLAADDWNITSSFGQAEVRRDDQFSQLRQLIEDALAGAEREA